jgi:hypothetical protein
MIRSSFAVGFTMFVALGCTGATSDENKSTDGSSDYLDACQMDLVRIENVSMCEEGNVCFEGVFKVDPDLVEKGAIPQIRVLGNELTENWQNAELMSSDGNFDIYSFLWSGPLEGNTDDVYASLRVLMDGKPWQMYREFTGREVHCGEPEDYPHLFGLSSGPDVIHQFNELAPNAGFVDLATEDRFLVVYARKSSDVEELTVTALVNPTIAGEDRVPMTLLSSEEADVVHYYADVRDIAAPDCATNDGMVHVGFEFAGANDHTYTDLGFVMTTAGCSPPLSGNP